MNGNVLRYRQATGFVGLATAALLVGIASLAQAQDTVLYWNNSGTAAWSNTANWTPGNFTSGTYGNYFMGQGMVINNGGTVNIDPGDNVTDTSSSSYGWGGYVYVGGSDFIGGSGGNGYVNMSGGTLNVDGSIAA